MDEIVHSFLDDKDRTRQKHEINEYFTEGDFSKTLSFDSYEINRLLFAETIFKKLKEKFGCFESFSCDLFSFLFEDFLSHYKDLPFHNKFHIIDVLYSLYHIILRTGIEDKILIESLFFGMLGHDICHPGHTNKYISDLISRDGPEYMHCEFKLIDFNFERVMDFHKYMAKEEQYLIRRRSHLEKMHTINTLKVISKYYHLVGKENYSQICKNITKIILATDIQTTKDLLSKKEFTEIDKLQLIAKCADIAHVTRNYSVHEKWASKIKVELSKEGILTSKRDQIDFLEKYCKPLYQKANEIFGGFDDYLVQIDKNIESWHEYVVLTDI